MFLCYVDGTPERHSYSCCCRKQINIEHWPCKRTKRYFRQSSKLQLKIMFWTGVEFAGQIDRFNTPNWPDLSLWNMEWSSDSQILQINMHTMMCMIIYISTWDQHPHQSVHSQSGQYLIILMGIIPAQSNYYCYRSCFPRVSKGPNKSITHKQQFSYLDMEEFVVVVEVRRSKWDVFITWMETVPLHCLPEGFHVNELACQCCNHVLWRMKII